MPRIRFGLTRCIIKGVRGIRRSLSRRKGCDPEFFFGCFLRFIGNYFFNSSSPMLHSIPMITIITHILL